MFFTDIPNILKLTSDGVLHYLKSGDLLKSFSQLTLAIFAFPNQ